MRSLDFQVGELNQFSYAPNPDRYRWNGMVLWVHETAFTAKSEAATAKKSGAAGFIKDSVRELFSLLERAVERKFNGIIIYVYNVYESALKTF